MHELGSRGVFEDHNPDTKTYGTVYRKERGEEIRAAVSVCMQEVCMEIAWKESTNGNLGWSVGVQLVGPDAPTLSWTQHLNYH